MSIPYYELTSCSEKSFLHNDKILLRVELIRPKFLNGKLGLVIHHLKGIYYFRQSGFFIISSCCFGKVKEKILQIMKKLFKLSISSPYLLRALEFLHKYGR